MTPNDLWFCDYYSLDRLAVEACYHFRGRGKWGDFAKPHCSWNLFGLPIQSVGTAGLRAGIPKRADYSDLRIITCE